ncbi:MAG: pyridoxamine 5'-phosphate oxidase family protein [Ferruginibacter sp.]
MQYIDENLGFLKSKIDDIKIALFKSEINSELQLPNNIIQTLKVDDEGHIWFLTSCSGNHKQHIDKSFYAYLDYYKKGTECRLQLGGKAILVDDEEDAFLSMSNYSKSTVNRLVLIKMKIMQAEYFENKPTENVGLKNKIMYAFNNLFFTPAHRVYDFS